jgi:hypothetical protein
VRQECLANDGVCRMFRTHERPLSFPRVGHLWGQPLPSIVSTSGKTKTMSPEDNTHHRCDRTALHLDQVPTVQPRHYPSASFSQCATQTRFSLGRVKSNRLQVSLVDVMVACCPLNAMELGQKSNLGSFSFALLCPASWLCQAGCVSFLVLPCLVDLAQ